MSQTFKVIQGADDIDLNQHAVIEASAGTGKTYTMVALVMCLLSDECDGLPLDEILLTTFTENAANELKTRIRQQIKKRLVDGGLSEAITQRFNKALQNIESAPIYTIHGFCQRMAGEYAFESGEIFDRELIDGDRVREDRFNAFVRSWPNEPDLKAAFQHYLTADKSNSLSRLKTTVLELAGKSNPDFDVIYPLKPDSLPDLENYSLLTDIANLEQQFLKLLTNKDGKISAYMLKNWQLRVHPVLEKLSQNDSTHEQKLQFLTSLINNDMAGKSCFKHFFLSAPKAYSDDNWENNKKQHPVICEQLEHLFGLIEQIKSHQRFSQAAIIKLSLDYLDKDISDYLSAQGQVTYDRIIRNLYNLLHQERQSNELLLTDAIRAQFSVIMIDEFQDTDPYQWHIFKWLFLDSPDSAHRLWVIGDPKQSIYGFRGADVNTYLLARNEIQQAGANSYRLNTNYRSIAPLITAFNQFFTVQQSPDGSGYWYPEDSIQVAAADRQKNPELPQLVQDNSGLSAFNYMPLDEDNTADARRSELADVIVDIIENRLIGRIEYTSDNESKVLNYDDICILVRANSDSAIIKKACQSLDIPVSIQRSKGLYQESEAIEFEVILSALHQPHDSGRVHNALSGLFFNQAYCQAEQLSEALKQDLNQQWLQLLAWAKSGDWVTVFDWLIEGSGTRLRAEKDGDKRQLANLQKIANTLCRYALKSNANCAELLRFYKKLRLTAHEQDQDHQNQDTDHQAVKVITMHAAKGLEFPVVFVFDGLTAPKNNKPYHKFYDLAQQATVYDVSKNSKQSQEETNHKEFKQLYYVAMTRAIYKLFLPYTDSSGLSVEYQQLVKDNIDRCQQSDINQSSRPFSTASADQAGVLISSTGHAPISLVPFSQSPAKLSARSRFIYSFSSLSHHIINQKTPGEQRRYGEVETVTDEPFADDVFVTETPLIPGGVTTGHVLHGLFEHVDFEAVITHQTLSSLWADESIMAVVDAQMLLFKMNNQNIKSDAAKRTQAIDYRQQMAAWVWHTLKKPLPMLNGQSLGMIGAKDRRHEMSFHWQHESQTLTGYIDLLFRTKNAQGGDDYYILDWKSNLNAEGYVPEVLAETVMKQHHYNLQFQLYAAAVETWFQHLNLPKARLKGAIYAFSRGIDCHSEDLQGIYYHEFTDLAEQNKQTGQHISALIAGAGA